MPYPWGYWPMQWDLKKSAGLVALTAIIALSVTAEARDRRGRGDKKAKVTQSDSRGLEPAPIAAAPVSAPIDNAVIPQNIVMYDEVGYASAYGDEMAGQATTAGEPFNPEGYSAAHPTLPMSTFVEVTNLDTGKTILVRVNDRAPGGNGRLVDLSAAAARELGVGQGGRAPVRVRRVNPPVQEQVALQSGQKASDRLDTPPQLLAALRKKLGTSPSAPAANPIRQASLPPSNPGQDVASAGASYETPVTDSDGFIVEEAGSRRPVRVAVAKPKAASPRVVSAPAGRPGASYEAPVVGKDGFIVEQAGQRSAAAPIDVAVKRGANGSYYVQVAAFSNEGRAKSTAGQVGAGVERAGNIWRVRKGPFASEASARAALGPIAAKGYRDARITR